VSGFRVAGTALHHKLCHVLGGSFDLPQRHRVQPRRRARGDGADRALGAEDPAQGLFDLAASLGAKQSLSDLGLRESDLDRAADLAVESTTRTRPRSPAMASARCSTTHPMAAGPDHRSNGQPARGPPRLAGRGPEGDATRVRRSRGRQDEGEFGVVILRSRSSAAFCMPGVLHTAFCDPHPGART
jgi:hypothetical protein